jgi:serine/threonine-protein kinase
MSFGNQTAITLGKYRLIAELGHGGMSDVYLAVAKGMGGFHKLLVVKQLRPNLAEDEAFLAMFLDEARLAARLNHRNVVSTLEVGEDGGRYYIAMEYLEGQPLRRVLQRAKERFGIDMRLQVILEVLQGLHHAHELRDYDGTPLRVVHRDVSPHNIFITYGGDVKVVDFGVAKALDSSTETSAGVMKGKLAYMSPEQAMGPLVDRRGDVFSVGVLLWESIVGARMWGGEPAGKITERLMAGDIPSVREAAVDVPDGLARICERALGVEPEHRYGTALEMHEDLLSYADSHGVRASSDDLGARVSKVFADDRLLMQTIIERQLHRIRNSPEGAEGAVGLVTIGPSAGEPTPSGVEQAANRSVNGGVDRSVNRSDGLGASGARERKEIFWKGGTFLGLALILVGVVSVWVWQGLRGTQATAVVASSGPPVLVAPQASIRVRITVKPDTARIYLDEALLPSNPYEGAFVVDAGAHRVRAEASGFVSEMRDVRFESDLLLDMTLAPVAVASGAVPIPVRPVGAPPGPRPKPETTRRPIDSEDPWKR